ncbi:hypothetical protein BC628DRAFT_1336777 [Trametes gibbosa]|nr:hypothetical protein BC628DRAFT_1336777 [Trametes gibbosa]
MKRSVYFCFLPVLSSTAALINRTIDDTYGDTITHTFPVYEPAEAWSRSDACQSCYIYPDNRQRPPIPLGAGAAVDTAYVFNSTWHDTTYLAGNGSRPYTITVNFTGQAVYVYNIIANTANDTVTTTTLVFNLDGEDVGSYTHLVDSTGPQLVYNQPVYINSSIPDGQHTLVISTGGTDKSLVMFDYIQYTVEWDEAAGASSHRAMPASCSSTSASSRMSPPFVGGLIGGIVGGLIAILVIVASMHIVRRYKAFRAQRQGRSQGGWAQDPAGGETAMRETTPPDMRLSRGATNSTSSLLAPSPCPSPSPSPSPSPAPRTSLFSSENFTAIAPYSDPKRAPRFSQLTSKPSPSLPVRSSTASSALHLGAPPPSESPLDAVDFEFTPAAAPPPTHSVDVPNPALSVTGTDRSLRHAELTREIQALEDAIRDLYFPGDADGSAEADARQGGERIRAARVRKLREEITHLRTQLAREKRLLLEATPQSRRHGKKVLAVVE